jgi:alkylation response protein AidB-like acyl-CoA dehydrogenase
MASGELIGAIAMTEPGAGSDLQGIGTTAVRDGSDWILNGSKTFITNGIHGDVIVTFARTDRTAGGRGFSLFVVEAGMPGFERGRKLEKVGLHGCDTAELFFHDVRVPAQNLLGTEGKGFAHLMENLPTERLSIALQAFEGARSALAWTVSYTTDRKAFGKPVAALQNTAFELADMATELDVMGAYLDASIVALNDRELTPVDAAKAKYSATELYKRVCDRCLQLFGGYGYMIEYPIARAYLDARVTTIFGGTSEVMKTIIARDLTGLRS